MKSDFRITSDPTSKNFLSSKAILPQTRRFSLQDLSIQLSPIEEKDSNNYSIIIDENISIKPAKCRFCLDENQTENLIASCKCLKSLKFTHEKCLKSQIISQNSIICRICETPYQVKLKYT